MCNGGSMQVAAGIAEKWGRKPMFDFDVLLLLEYLVLSSGVKTLGQTRVGYTSQ